jgi:hypothetical protein
VNHEVTAPERIIGTFEFEGLPEAGHVVPETAVFEALPGNRTRVAGQSVFRSHEQLDELLALLYGIAGKTKGREPYGPVPLCFAPQARQIR